MQHEHFDLAKFLLNKMVETQQIPRRHVKDNPAVKLGARILGLGGLAPLTEAEFNAACSETFVELSFFGKADAMEQKKEIGALLSIYWICTSQYDKFVRGQGVKARLTSSSWEKLQEWTRHRVGLTNNQLL